MTHHGRTYPEKQTALNKIARTIRPGQHKLATYCPEHAGYHIHRYDLITYWTEVGYQVEHGDGR